MRLKSLLSQVKDSVNVTATSVAQLQLAILTQYEHRIRDKRSDPMKPKTVEPERLFSPSDDAFAQVRAREAILRQSIAAASIAPPETAAAAQAQVAADYEAYARAVTVAETAARSAARGVLATASPDGF